MGEVRSDTPGTAPPPGGVSSDQELSEAREQLAATGEILRAIAASPSGLNPVFATITEHAARLCKAYDAIILLRDGEWLVVAGHYGEIPIGFDRIPLNRNWSAGCAVLDDKPVHVHDLLAAVEEFPEGQAMAARLGHRTMLTVPLTKEGGAIGSLTIRRQEMQPFSPDQISLLQTFADQAVIAIENARLLAELETRNRDVSEALEQQTAAADVLKVISRSSGALEPVFEAMLANATRLCGAEFGNLVLREREMFRDVALFNAPAAFEEFRRLNPILNPGPDSPLSRIVHEKRPIQVSDLAVLVRNEPPNSSVRQLLELAGARTFVLVPMLKDEELIGAIVIYRQEVRPFSEKQIELLENFADQAVIAIENARLLNELREALAQQTATADVLKVISRSAFDLQTVLDTLVESAVRLCRADKGGIVRSIDGAMRYVSTSGYSPETSQYLYDHPPAEGRGSAVGRVVEDRRIIHIPDVREDPDYEMLRVAEVGSFRTVLAVPLIRQGALLGVFAMVRDGKPQPFTDKEIELVQSFADQAVIAIENVRLFDEVKARTEELTESLRQQTATADVLKVISRSTFDLQAVLETLLESAARLCDADHAWMFQHDGDRLTWLTSFGHASEVHDRLKEYFIAHPLPTDRGSVSGRAVLEARVIHVPDVLADPDYQQSVPQKIGGYRAALGVPLLRDGTVLGVIFIAKSVPQPFSASHIELVTSFADQALIALENARLLNELREALQQQTATAEVLKVISRSAFDLQVVLDALTESAAQLCGAEMAAIVRRKDDAYYWATAYQLPPEYKEYLKSIRLGPGRGNVVGRVLAEGQTVHVPDVLADPEYAYFEAQSRAGYRSLLGVPLLRAGTTIGVLLLMCREVRPFTDTQIEMVTTFADQAVIAIENARLFEEVQAKTRDVEEALERQTATSEILRVISTSPTDARPVFETIARNAMALCGSLFANVFRFDGELIHFVTSHNVVPDHLGLLKSKYPMRPDPSQVAGRVVLQKSIVWIEDVGADTGYDQTFPTNLSWRRLLGVPMLREGEPVGIIVVGWKDPGPPLKAEEQLLATFADQAVIAIENVRLFDEVQSRSAELSEALHQQTATAEVLKAISRSAFDLKTVLQTLVESAARLCDADRGVITRPIDGVFYRMEAYGHSPEFMAFVKEVPVTPDRGSVTGRAMLESRVVHIPDVEVDTDYTFSEGRRIDTYRTMLGVPMMREGVPLGVLALTRTEVRPFTEKQIELVSTFADQAAIAIENSRLFEEVRARTEELSRSLDELRTTQDRLVHTEKLASLGQLTAGIAHEIKNPLNFVNNFSSLSAELVDELNESLRELDLTPEKQAEIGEVADLLRGNLQRVVQHGRRADSIVKNMLLHSRQGSGERRKADINAIVEESLNLAYHGARAEKPGFNITMEKSLDPEAGEVDLYPQEITRVLLNLISNGFYAATKRKEKADRLSFEPTLAATTRNLGDSVEIRIRDNGTGIPPEVREKLFSPFFTTKPAGEGTGLGLSLSHDIVVKQHAGSIEVESEPGAFTEFRIILPRAAEAGEQGAEP
jgi:GAF domain-containing protein